MREFLDLQLKLLYGFFIFSQTAFVKESGWDKKFDFLVKKCIIIFVILDTNQPYHGYS